jgi:hypothetical protein
LADWYFVTKTINGRRYRYRQRTWRENGQVRTESHYLGPETLPIERVLGEDDGQMFTPRLDVLPPAQRQLWSELNTTPASFVLYGGTALALRLGHRVSVDFDFFAPNDFRPSELRAQVPYLKGGRTVQEEPNTLTMRLDRGGPVQVSFFGVPSLGQVEPHETAAGPGLKVASLIDIAGTKAGVVYQRAEPKDYFDIHALLTQAKIPLATMLASARAIYGEEFNPLISLKAMAYHDDVTLSALPEGIRRDLIAAVRQVDASNLPLLNPVRPRDKAS